MYIASLRRCLEHSDCWPLRLQNESCWVEINAKDRLGHMLGERVRTKIEAGGKTKINDTCTCTLPSVESRSAQARTSFSYLSVFVEEKGCLCSELVALFKLWQGAEAEAQPVRVADELLVRSLTALRPN